ncbi:hypothetical protein NFI96_020313 [Prochilodus magdalenae]|nr:hypothetical protein NFI96_020313 [Prochilodus magdalenae]
MDGLRALLLVLLVLLYYCTAVLAGGHSLTTAVTYIKGDTPFPEFNLLLLLDDIPVLHFNSEDKVLIPRGLDKTVEEDGVINPKVIKTVISHMHADLEERWLYATYDLNVTDKVHVQQRLGVCELMDNQPGQMITKNAFLGSTLDELLLHKGKFTYESVIDLTEAKKKLQMDLSLWRYENLFYPVCIQILEGYLKQRSKQVGRKVKPRVRLIQRRRSVSGWDGGVPAGSLGFYYPVTSTLHPPILRDGQPVPDHLITGGDLLPNDDGTYQMRKHLELSQEELKKQNYTCTVTHLSLDNKLDVHLGTEPQGVVERSSAGSELLHHLPKWCVSDLDPGEPIGPILSSVLAALVLVCVVIVTCMIYRRRRAASSQRGYSSASSE